MMIANTDRIVRRFDIVASTPRTSLIGFFRTIAKGNNVLTPDGRHFVGYWTASP
jgi:hypothetical protein